MRTFLWPAFAGLFLAVLPINPAKGSDLADFSRDEALAYSQAVIGSLAGGVELLVSGERTVRLEAYRGKPLIISLIFSSCHHICPTTTQNLADVVNKARDALGEDSFNVLTVGFDTANDTPERMATFGRQQSIDDPYWDFVGGSPAAIDALTRQLGFIFTPSSRGFDHLVQSTILDADGRVSRQLYGIQFPTPHLIEPLKQLVFGEAVSPSTLDYLEARIRLFCTVYDPATDSYHVDVSVFIGTFVGLIVSILFGRVLFKEWRRSLKAGK